MQKPQANFITFYRTEGRYNLADSKQESAQYIIQGIDREVAKENGFDLNYLVDIEKDHNYDPKSETVLYLAEAIQAIYDDYWLHSGKAKIKKLIEYLQPLEEEQEILRARHRVEVAKYELDSWSKELVAAEEYLADLEL